MTPTTVAAQATEVSKVPESDAAYRARMRAQAMMPLEIRPGVEIWVPDVNSPHFAAEAHRQSLLVANSPGEKDDMAFIDSLYEPAEWNEE